MRSIPTFFSYILLLGVLFSCKGNQGASEVKEDEKPYWLSGGETDPGYYVGIGYSSKSDGNYTQIAKKGALQDLISEIKVNVSSSSILTQVDKDNEFKEEYENMIQTSTAEEIQDFEQVGSYENEEGYWVYYRLSKSRYAMLKEQQRQDAIDLAQQFRRNAEGEEQRGEIAQALNFYAKSFKSLEKFLGEPIRVEMNGNEVLLGVEIFTRLQATVNRVRVTTPQKKIKTGRILNEGLKIPVSVSKESDSTILEGIPLRAGFSVGQGDVHPSYYSDAKGNANVLVSRIDSRSALQKLRVAVDPSVFLGDDESQLSVKVLKTLVQPQVFVEFEIERPVIFLSSEDLVFEKPSNSMSYGSLIKSSLTDAGFSLSKEAKGADLKMEIKGSIDKGSQSGSTCISYANLEISAINVKSGDQVYQGGFSGLKGYSNDFDRSARQAYKEGSKKLENEILPELIESILR